MIARSPAAASRLVEAYAAAARAAKVACRELLESCKGPNEEMLISLEQMLLELQPRQRPRDRHHRPSSASAGSSRMPVTLAPLLQTGGHTSDEATPNTRATPHRLPGYLSTTDAPSEITEQKPLHDGSFAPRRQEEAADSESGSIASTPRALRSISIDEHGGAAGIHENDEQADPA